MVANIPPVAPLPFDGANSKAFGTRVESISRLDNIPIRPSTKTHKPLVHSEVARWGEHVLKDVLNLTTSEPTILVTNDDFRSTMWIGWGIAGDEAGQEKQLVIVADNGKDIALLPLAALNLTYCSNGMNNSLDLSKTKHTGRVNDVGKDGMTRWQRVIAEGFTKATDGFTQMRQIVDSHTRVELDRKSKVHQRMAQSTIMKLMLANVINPASTKKMWDYWMDPMSQESVVHKKSNTESGEVVTKRFEEDSTVWSLVQAATACDRGKNIFTRHKRNRRMLDIIAQDYGCLDSSGSLPVREAGQPVPTTVVTSGAEF